MRFQHQPLSNATNQIRVVQLERTTGWVKLQIHHVSLDDEPVFAAVSYEWGPTTPTREIFIDSKVFTIRENLWQFLNMARGHSEFDTNVYLWIDQICIDQSSIRERNYQVALMSRIYSSALRVVIWLGPSRDDSDLALRTLAEDQSSDPWISVWDPTAWGARSTRKAFVSKDIDDGIRALMSRSYFERLWIVQECVLARNREIWCGETHIDGDKFFAHTNKRRRGTPMDCGSKFDLYMDGVRQITLSAALQRYCELQCSNALDHVYGVQGIVEPDERLDVDYGKPAEEVLLDVIDALEPLDNERLVTVVRVAQAMDVVRVMSASTIERWARAVLPQNEDNYDYMRTVIKKWKRQNYVQIAAKGSPRVISEWT